MKITLQQFQQAVAAHMAEAVIPHIANHTMQWFLAGATATGALLNQRVLGAMQMAGLIDTEGNVDVDKLETFSKAAFASQPKVETPFAVTFEQADADAFLNRLRRG